MKKTEITQLLAEDLKAQSVADNTLFSPQPPPSTQAETASPPIPQTFTTEQCASLLLELEALPTTDLSLGLGALTSVLRKIALFKQYYAIARKETRENPQLTDVLQRLRDTAEPIFEQLILSYLNVYSEKDLHDLFDIAKIGFTTMFKESTPGDRTYLVQIHWSDDQS
jgi:hypothetical protein